MPAHAKRRNIQGTCMHAARTIAFLATLLLSFPVWAAGEVDNEAIKGVLSRYWKSFSAMDFHGAASHIHPDDLASIKQHLVPVFVDAGKSDNREVRQFADVFFNGATVSARAEISAEQACAGLNLIIAKGRPEIFQRIKDSTVDIVDVHISRPGEASVRYTLTLPDGEAEDEDRFTKVGGTWYLRVKEPPEVTASKFRKLLAP